MAAKTPRDLIKPATMRASDISATVGIDRATLYRWLQRGIFPPPTIRVGRTVRWSVAVVEKFIAEGVTDLSEVAA
jgi:predicted DNA-binding transcriptional regulator AlpA